MIVDTHVHVVAPDTQRYPFVPATGFRMGSLASWHIDHPVSAEQMVETTRAAGVDRAIVVQPFSAYGFDNRYHADSAAQHAGRLIGVCAVDPVTADAPERLTYWIRECGMQGLRLTTNQEGARLDDPRAYPLWEQAQALGIPINLLTSPAHWDAARAMASRYPGVRVALDHAGGMGAGRTEEAVQALLSLADLPNLCVKVSTVNFAPLAALGETGVDRWRQIVSRFGAERLLWGSNYPVSQEGSYADMVELGQGALPFLSDTERDWLMGGTAQGLYPGLKG